jgi:aminoglycoside phosphotransferase (APT) family kinase protein
LDLWRSYFEKERHPAHCASPVLVHRDLAAEHILLNERTGKLSGIIDWSDISISDPAVDLAGAYHWGGEQFVHALLSVYDRQLTEDSLRCARLLGACRGVGDIRFGLQMHRQEYVSAGLRALRLCVPR